MNLLVHDLKLIYLSSFLFAVACPLLFFIPVLGEFLQHVVEIEIGMYESRGAFKTLENHDARQLFGVFKIIAISLPSYWYVRYLGYGNSPEAARRFDKLAVALWLVVMMFSVSTSLISVFSSELTSLLNLKLTTSAHILLVSNIVLGFLGFYLLGWTIAWPLGNASIGWITSARLMNGFVLWAIVYLILGVAPYMLVHYAFTIWAMGSSEEIVWFILSMDSMLVGLLGLNVIGTGYFAVLRAADTKGVNLLPPRTPELSQAI
ncbi:MAG: hypothetical protein JJ956_19890 [Pseudomonadales bacterium]|nr:hypothetical protein [Pseudomonadales bacterium]